MVNLPKTFKNLLNRKVNAFAMDTLYLFAGATLLMISLVTILYFTTEFNTVIAGQVGETEVVAFNTNFQELDWAVPFFVGGAIVATLLYASIAGSIPIAIVLFMIMSLIVTIIIVYVNDFNTQFMTMMNTMGIPVLTQMPLTYAVFVNLPIILTVTLILMGALMHSRQNY